MALTQCITYVHTFNLLHHDVLLILQLPLTSGLVLLGTLKKKKRYLLLVTTLRRAFFHEKNVGSLFDQTAT